MAPHDGSDDPTGLLYGFHTVLEALQSRTRAIQRLWVIRSDGRYFPLTRLAKERGIPFSIESRERLDQLANDRHHQGVVANITSKEYLEGEELLDSLLESPTPALLVVLDQIQDPHNLGAVIRSVDAAGGTDWSALAGRGPGREDAPRGAEHSTCGQGTAHSGAEDGAQQAHAGAAGKRGNSSARSRAGSRCDADGPGARGCRSGRRRVRRRHHEPALQRPA